MFASPELNCTVIVATALPTRFNPQTPQGATFCPALAAIHSTCAQIVVAPSAMVMLIAVADGALPELAEKLMQSSTWRPPVTGEAASTILAGAEAPLAKLFWAQAHGWVSITFGTQ